MFRFFPRRIASQSVAWTRFNRARTRERNPPTIRKHGRARCSLFSQLGIPFSRVLRSICYLLLALSRDRRNSGFNPPPSYFYYFPTSFLLLSLLFFLFSLQSLSLSHNLTLTYKRCVLISETCFLNKLTYARWVGGTLTLHGSWLFSSALLGNSRVESTEQALYFFASIDPRPVFYQPNNLPAAAYLYFLLFSLI